MKTHGLKWNGNTFLNTKHKKNHLQNKLEIKTSRIHIYMK